MEQYGIWSLLPVALITALTIGTGEILYGILLCLVFLCRFVFAPEADDARAYMETIMVGFKNMLGVPFCLSALGYLIIGFLWG